MIGLMRCVFNVKSFFFFISHCVSGYIGCCSPVYLDVCVCVCAHLCVPQRKIILISMCKRQRFIFLYAPIVMDVCVSMGL